MPNSKVNTPQISMTGELSQNRTADRKLMAQKIAELAPQFEASADVSASPTECSVKLTAKGGLTTTLTFRAKASRTDLDTHVVSWVLPSSTGLFMDLDTFGRVNVNPYHFRKATHVVEGFDALLNQVSFILAKAQTGEAYRALTAGV
jgi:hypothetical protein